MSDVYNGTVAPETEGEPPAPIINPTLGLSAPVQTTYPTTMPPGLPGQPATMVSWDADTRVVELPAGGIGFGLAVSKGTSDRGIVLGGAAKFAGVTYRDITALGPIVDVYPQYQNAGVCVRGDIWVLVKAAVVAGTGVNYDNTTGQLGAATGAGATAIAGAVWMTSQSTVNGLAIVRLMNGPANA